MKSMKKQTLIYFCLLFIFSSCGSEAEVEEQTEGNDEVLQDSVVSEENEVILIDMNPSVEYESLSDYEEYNKESILSLNGSIGEEAIRMQLFVTNRDYEGRYFYVNRPEANFPISGEIIGLMDTFSLARFKDDEVRETFNMASKDNQIFEGYWTKEGDTLNLELELTSAKQSTTQFLIDHVDNHFLTLTEEGLYQMVETGYPRCFNTFQTFKEEGTGTDTGQMWDDYQSAVFRIDSTIVLIESEVYNMESANYLEGHGYDSDDPISEGYTLDAQVDITINVIKNGMAEEKELKFNHESDNLDLFIFQDYLIFAGIETDLSIIYKWSQDDMNYLLLK
jgi:hypothetical protein